MYKYPYKLLKNRLSTEIPALKEVAWELGQGTREAKGSLKTSPTVTIRFLPTDMKSLGNGIQEGTVNAEIKLLTDCLYDDDKRVEDTDEEALNHLDLVDEIHKAISGYSGMLSHHADYAELAGTENDVRIFNTADRIGINTDQSMGSIMVTVQTFKMYTKDYSGNPEFQKIVKPLEIKNFEISP